MSEVGSVTENYRVKTGSKIHFKLLKHQFQGVQQPLT